LGGEGNRWSDWPKGIEKGKCLIEGKLGKNEPTRGGVGEDGWRVKKRKTNDSSKLMGEPKGTIKGLGTKKIRKRSVILLEGVGSHMDVSNITRG